jgi:Activator of Hsp90 ATPase, N-terminal
MSRRGRELGSSASLSRSRSAQRNPKVLKYNLSRIWKAMWRLDDGSQSTLAVSSLRGQSVDGAGTLFRLITIFDVRLELRWKGTTTDGTDVSGSLTIPEVSHENVLDGVSDFTVSRRTLPEFIRCPGLFDCGSFPFSSLTSALAVRMEAQYLFITCC